MNMFLLLAAAALAQEPAAVSTASVALAACHERVLTANPAVLAAKARWEAAVHAAGAAGAWPDPQLGVARALRAVETRGGPITGGVQFTQPLPFPGKLGRKAAAAARRAEAARQAYLAVRLEARAAVTAAHNELYYLRRADEILGEQVELLRHFARVAEKKYAVRKGPQAMVFRAQAELSKLQNERITVRQQMVSARTRLNSLLDRKPWTPVGDLAAPGRPEVDWRAEDLRARALAARPEMLAAKALAGAAEAEREAAWRDFFPDFAVGYDYTRIGPGPTTAEFSGRDAHAVRLGIRLPLFGRSDAYAAARERAAAGSLSARDVENATLALVEDLAVRAETALRLYEVDENTVLPQIRAALRATQSGYESDAVGFLDLLDAERTLLELELKHIHHLTMFHDTVAQLERVVGGEL